MSAVATAGAAVAATCTGGIVWWYTEETKKLRETAEAQLAASYRPLLVLEVILQLDGARHPILAVRNIGQGPAFHVQFHNLRVGGYEIYYDEMSLIEPMRPEEPPKSLVPAKQIRNGEPLMPESPYDLPRALSHAVKNSPINFGQVNPIETLLDYTDLAGTLYRTRSEIHVHRGLQNDTYFIKFVEWERLTQR